MTDVFTIRQAEAEDTPQILLVLRAALGESPLLRRTPELFAWKHLDNPFGRSIVLVATRGSQVIGVRALMRWELVPPSGGTIKCVRPVDTATHPDFSRKGIFRALTLEALDVARDSGVQLVFNTPNRMSAAGYFTMGWKEVGWTGAIVRPRLGKAISVENGQSPSLAKAVPDAQPFRAADVADRAPLGLRTPRTPEYLSWRFSQHPTAQYGWLGDPSGGGLIVRASERNGRVETVIADLLGGAGPSVVRRLARSSRARYLATWFARHTPERRAVLRAGMIPVPALKTLRLVVLPLTDLDIDVLDIGSWDFALSDLELL